MSRISGRSALTRRRKLISRGLLGDVTYTPDYSPAVEHYGPLPDSAGWEHVRSLLREKTPVTIVASGDNILAAPAVNAGDRNCVERLATYLRQQRSRAYDVIMNSAVHGDTLSRLLKYWSFRVRRFHPQIVLLSLGMNDAKAGIEGLPLFVTQLADLQSRLAEEQLAPVIFVPHPINFGLSPQRQALPEYAAAICQWSESAGYATLDLWSHWQRHWPTKEKLLPWLVDERLHLSAAGHGEIADWLEHSLGDFSLAETEPQAHDSNGSEFTNP